MAQAFANQAMTTPGKVADLHLGTRAISIRKSESGFTIQTSRGDFGAACVVVCAGAHSLLLAQSMGFGMDYSILPVIGSFYYTPARLRGKVYTVQNDKLPFAAIHGDPDILAEGRTRFGPTALVMPRLERYHGGTTAEFLRTLHPGPAVAKVLWSFVADPDIRRFMFKNLLFETPGLQRRHFLKEIRKIVPSMRLEDLEFAHGVGGIRPQIIDRKQKRLLLGEAKIDPGNGIIFNLTPSPGATSCLDIAEADAARLMQMMGIPER
jgi:malate dehydrogenase (quinone)